MKFFFKKNNFYKKYKKKKVENFLISEGDFIFYVQEKNFNLFLSKNSYLYLERFLKILVVNGNKKKIKIYLSKSFFNFFYLINLKNKFFDGFSNILEIINHNFKINKNLYLISSIIQTVSEIVSTNYQIKITKVRKKKKTKPTTKISVDYVYPKNRVNLSFQWIILYSKSFNDTLFYNRLFKSIFYTYVEGKSSYLFLKKIQTYNFMFELNKKKKK